MKSFQLLLITLLFSYQLTAQIKFEKGYFISNDGTKTTCLIKNFDWKNNPTKIIYKLNKSSSPLQKSIKEIKEFAINNFSKFERHTVEIDKSSSYTDKLSKTRKFSFTKETLFLKVLVEGKANLYYYEKNNLSRYFYKTAHKPVEPLKFKFFENSDGNIAKNSYYLIQLKTNLPIKKFNIRNIKYKKNSLTNYFKKYNNHNSSLTKDFTSNETTSAFHITGIIGLGSYNISIGNSFSYIPQQNFNSNLFFKVGANLEYALPFNKNKWALFIEPTYQENKLKSELKRGGTYSNNITYKFNLNYTFIELPVGVKHYFFLTQDSKINLNISYAVDVPINSIIDFDTRTDLTKLESVNSYILGIGYVYKNKYWVDLKYNLNKNIFYNYFYWQSSNLTSFSISVGYQLL